MPEIVTIGETMVSLAPGKSGFLRYADSFSPGVAGAESNVAVYASRFGHTSGWISRLGEDEFGYLIQNAVRAEGVDASQVKFVEGGRTGVMFRQMLTGRETSVFYYRNGSAASGMDETDLPETYLREAKILHLTGITPVLSESCLEMTQKAIKMARDWGCMVSFDPNVRKKLWGGQDYRGVLREMALEADIVLLGLEEGRMLFETEDPESLLKLLFQKGRAKYVAVKNGDRGAVAATREESVEIPPYPCHCVDPIGAGDAFNAGFLCGILENLPVEQCGKMGAAAGAMATECVGDTGGCPSRRYLEDFLRGREEVAR